MARNKTKICVGCQRLFEARKDAKTCSARCRKRFQRARAAYIANLANEDWYLRAPLPSDRLSVARLKQGENYAGR